MIIAIEGPDGVGKTTLVNRLRTLFRYLHFIQFKKVPAAFYENIAEMEPLVFKLFEQMYEPRMTYVCDRFFSVSSRVYAKLHGRCYELSDAWVMPDLHIIRLNCKLATLRRRRPKESQLVRLDKLYHDVCENLPCATYHTIDNDEAISDTVRQSADLIRSLCVADLGASVSLSFST